MNSLSPLQSRKKDEYILSFRTFPPKVEDDVIILQGVNPTHGGQGPPPHFLGTQWGRKDPSSNTLRVLSTVRLGWGGLPGGSWKAPHGYDLDISTPERLLEAATVVAMMPAVYSTLTDSDVKKKFFSLQFTLRKGAQAKGTLASYLQPSALYVGSVRACVNFSKQKYRPLWVLVSALRVAVRKAHAARAAPPPAQALDLVWSPVRTMPPPALVPREQGLLAAFRALPDAHQEGALRKLQQAVKHGGEKRKREEALAAAEAAVKKAREEAARCVSPTWD